MNFDLNNNLVPYSIGGEKSEEFYSRLRIFSWELFSSGKVYFDKILSKRLFQSTGSDNEKKDILIQLLLIGILIKCHSKTAKTALQLNTVGSKPNTRFPGFDELSGIESEILNKVQDDFTLDFSMDELKSLIDQLRNTQEYEYESNILEKWLGYWKECSPQVFYSEIARMVVFADFFIDFSQRYIGKYFNNTFFIEQLPLIDLEREDFYQITKTLPEYYLNAIAAIWMNEMNQEVFDSKTNKKIMAPACMRPNNGKDCQAIPSGSYLYCTGCNALCNVNTLRQKGLERGFDVMLVLHQSTFKIDVDQLKGSGIVGIACMSCLLSGGLMLQNKDIHALCVMLDKPGCKKHWTTEGEMTSISYDELNRVIGQVNDEVKKKISALF